MQPLSQYFMVTFISWTLGPLPALNGPPKLIRPINVPRIWIVVKELMLPRCHLGLTLLK